MTTSAASASDALPEREAEATRLPSDEELERTLVLWLTNMSHAVNHFQNQMVSALYPVIMSDLGLSYTQLGVVTAIRNVIGNGSQISYGMLAQFIRRTHLLALSNIILGIGTFFTGFVGSYPGFIVARIATSVGSSAQHPVGSSLLAGYFPRNRGAILALNSSIANVGSLFAPAVAGILLLWLGWRQIFFVVAILSVLMGAAYFFFHDRVGAAAQGGSKRAKLARGKESYLRVLKNRNLIIISLVLMAGAAGGEGGVNQTYLGPHLVNDLGLGLALAGVALSVMQFGNIVGPLGFGWLSDRISRKKVMQASLLLSALGTLSLAYQEAYMPHILGFLGTFIPNAQEAFLPVLLLNLLIYGGITSSRSALTQALVADSLLDEDRDAAFSVYYFIGFFSDPIWSLVTGVLMENAGFTFAFSRLSVSYLIGMVLLFFVVDPREMMRKHAHEARTV